MLVVPASITCFFSPEIHSNPLKSGSLGVGIAIKHGVRVKLCKGNDREHVIFNGRSIKFPTVEYVLKTFQCNCVEIFSDLPLGCGFGISGASTLATLIEINKKFKLSKSIVDLADFAHKAEVLNKTGLGDIVTQFHGGVVVRLSPGSPSRALVKKLNWDLKLDILIMGPMNTKEILESQSINKIKKIGKLCLRNFLKEPTVENLFKQSKIFSVETNLITNKIRDIIEAVEAEGGLASMVMIGNSVFAYKGYNALKNFGNVISSEINNKGVKELSPSEL